MTMDKFVGVVGTPLDQAVVFDSAREADHRIANHLALNAIPLTAAMRCARC
jgi:hypothetical protein